MPNWRSFLEEKEKKLKKRTNDFIMSKNIEIEERGPLREKEFNDLLNFMEDNAKFIEKQKRLTLMYFKDNKIPECVTEIEDEKTDLRLRITNKDGELVLKHGNWSGSDIRKEFSVNIGNKDFEDTIHILNILGWHVAATKITETYLYKYKGIEFSIVEIKNYGYQYEAEILASEKPDEKRKEIKEVLEKLELPTFTEEEFIEQCNSINHIKGHQFDFRNDNPEDVRYKFSDFF